MCHALLFKIDYMARFYYFVISRKEVPRKSWLNPRFPRNLKLKCILKRLPLDRGYFKVHFSKGKNFIIISCHISLLIHNVSFYFKSYSPCHAFLFTFELSRNSLLLINNPLKRGDVETLVRSSVSPPPQVENGS